MGYIKWFLFCLVIYMFTDLQNLRASGNTIY